LATAACPFIVTDCRLEPVADVSHTVSTSQQFRANIEVPYRDWRAR